MNRDTSRREPMPTPPKPTLADEASISAFNSQARVAQAAALPAGAPAVSSVEKPSIHAPGINVSTTSAVSVHRGSGGPNQVSASSESLATRGPLGRGERSESNISANQRESAAKDSGLALPKPDPRLTGILDNPLNYYRHYDDLGKSRMDKIVNEHHHWPQPADDKLPPDIVYPMPDGTRMPFTIVNRHPRMANHLAAGCDQNERWPVTLDKKERAQVATARFYELLAAARSAMEQQQTEAKNNREQTCSAVS